MQYSNLNWHILGGQVNADQKKWLLLSAPYAEFEYYANNLLKELNRLAETNCANVKDILLILFTHYLPCSDYQGDIRALIKKIWHKGFRREANNLMNKLRSINEIQELYKSLHE